MTVGEDRQYGGNVGYQDELRVVYRYDSNVANHQQVEEGDFVVLRDKQSALGAAQMAAVRKTVGTKRVRRCPVCRTTGNKFRHTRLPQWRCNRKHEFALPIEVDEPVKLFEAHFHETFNPFVSSLSARETKACALRPSDQLSIEELDLRALERLFAPESSALRLLQTAVSASSINPSDGDNSPDDEALPSLLDQRERALCFIKVRRGQQMFRRALIKQYGAACTVTGCRILDLLEAAHIVPYRGEQFNHPANGLLLRADIHTLFDLGLLAIHPENLRVLIHDRARDDVYGAYHGTPLRLLHGRPSSVFLSLSWRQSFRSDFQSGFASA